MSKSLAQNVIFYGNPNPLPERVPLRAGPVTLVCEGGDLRYLRLGSREIIRRVYVAVRDRNWGTVPAQITKLDVVNREDSFRVFYEAEHRDGDVHFTWRAEIVGEPTGLITFTMDGQARSTFLKNRIGFCVLHPIHECAGAPCRVYRANGTVSNLQFPNLVAPEQPLKGIHDLAGFAHEESAGRWVELKFSGDVFEMEDQRNWIDASYKTYCTPLRLPYPVQIQSGARVQQQIRMEISGSSTPVAPVEPSPLEVQVRTESVRKLPKIGLGISSLSETLSPKAISRLRGLALSHLRMDLRLASPEWHKHFRRALGEAQELGVPMEMALFLPREGNVAWPEVRRALQQSKGGIVRFLVFADGEKTTTARALGLARQHLADFRVPMGVGTNADFYQLNQNRPTPGAGDFVVWSMNPQVHASDLASLVETPQAISAQIESAREFFPKKPLAISPITLKPRFNPVATGLEPPLPPGELPRQVDARQMSLIGAGWTLAAVKYLAEAGVDSVTFYETTGWRGVMETERGSLLPAKFPSIAGSVFPMYHVFADLGEFGGGEVLPSVSTLPLTVNAVALRKEERVMLLLANLSEKRQSVRVSGIALAGRMRLLDESSVEAAMREPEAFRAKMIECTSDLELPPFACCRVDIDAGKS